jgi:hypothetical protein
MKVLPEAMHFAKTKSQELRFKQNNVFPEIIFSEIIFYVTRLEISGFASQFASQNSQSAT